MTPPPPKLDYEGSWEPWKQFHRIIHALKHVLYQDTALGNVHTSIKKKQKHLLRVLHNIVPDCLQWNILIRYKIFEVSSFRMVASWNHNNLI